MGRLRISHYSIRLGRYGFYPDRPFKAAVIADLHDRVYRSDVEHVVRAAQREGCEIALSAGDLVLREGERYLYENAIDLIEGLSASMPVYLTDGNHEVRMARVMPDEYDSYIRKAGEAGAVNLVNSSADINLHGVPIHLTGLVIDRKYFRRMSREALEEYEIRNLAGEPENGSYNILLAHQPRFFKAYAEWGADLTLSGHLHGGIVRLPHFGGVISPDPALFPYYDHGRYADGKSEMIVSAGLGTHTIQLRVNNPAELVIIHFDI